MYAAVKPILESLLIRMLRAGYGGVFFYHGFHGLNGFHGWGKGMFSTPSRGWRPWISSMKNEKLAGDGWGILDIGENPCMPW